MLRIDPVQIILNQKERDNNLGHLLEVMADAYAFVKEAQPVKKIESQNRIIMVMVRQTTECSYFIREYATTVSFSMSLSIQGTYKISPSLLLLGKRVLEHILSDTDNKIKQYENKFKELKSALQERGVLQTEITVFRILDIVRGQGQHILLNTESRSNDSIAEAIDLNDIPYAPGARFNPEKGCLPGTREQIIEEIIQWVNRPNGEDAHCIYFLSGVAGSGKSAIVHTIAQHFDHSGRLGSSFCFDRADQIRRRPDYLFSTITLDIADLDPHWKTALCNVVKGKRALRSTLAPGEQFTNFILKPSEALTTVGPLVIVIDGLDESGNRAAREVLLKIIRDGMHALPSNFRVLVTSRPEPDIHEALTGKPHICRKHMDSIGKKENEADITLYIRRQLVDVTALELEWPNQEWCRLLLQSSDGLFQWASTACSAIKEGKGALHPTERLTRFIASARGLDGLYSEILGQAFDSSDSEDMFRFTSIMGRVLAAKEPLSVTSLSQLHSENEQLDIVELVMRPLASLLSGVTRADIAVRPLHASFSDFLMNKERSGQFYVDPASQHRNLALASWRVMKAKFRFNICELETSYLKNQDVPDLENRVTKHIPAHQSYACRFWEDHAREIIFKSTEVQILKVFLHEHFLHWLEALSLIGQLSSASSALESSSKWIKVIFLNM
jgi:hypothetical protein